MKSDSRGLIAIVISTLVFILWYSFIVPKFWPVEKKEETKQEAVAKPSETAPQKAEIAEPAKKEISQKEIKEVASKIETDEFTATFSNYGAVPTSWELKKYTAQKDGHEVPIDLISSNGFSIRPLELSFDKLNVGIPARLKYTLVESNEKHLKYRWVSNEIMIEKTYTLGENKYDITLSIEIKNVGSSAIIGRPTLGWVGINDVTQKKGFFSFLKGPENIKQPIYLLDGKVTRETNPRRVVEEEIKKGKVYWAGIEDRYFLSAILPRGEGENLGVELKGLREKERTGFYSGVSLPEFTISPAVAEKYTFSLYAGPKEMQILKGVGMGLDQAIDYGWFTVIAIPILYALKFLYSVVRNYGIAIIVLTILIKLLMNPISKKSMKSMKEMQKLQPRLKELKEKFKDNKERLNVETMQLFRAHKVNPMSGCLPMILQLPVYIALYRVLWNSIELYKAPFFWFYTDLSQPDPYFITPVLLGVAMFLQQKMTPATTMDPAQQKMMTFMPLMFTAFLAFLPVGLVVYILVNTGMTVVQQWMNNNDIKFGDLIRGRIPKKVIA